MLKFSAFLKTFSMSNFKYHGSQKHIFTNFSAFKLEERHGNQKKTNSQFHLTRNKTEQRNHCFFFSFSSSQTNRTKQKHKNRTTKRENNYTQ